MGEIEVVEGFHLGESGRGLEPTASSHAHDGHELTPGERVAGLQFIVDDILANGSNEEKALLEGVVRTTVSVAEFIRFVKLNCSDDPLFLPF